jgi:hypothetical protein
MTPKERELLLLLARELSWGKRALHPRAFKLAGEIEAEAQPETAPETPITAGERSPATPRDLEELVASLFALLTTKVSGSTGYIGLSGVVLEADYRAICDILAAPQSPATPPALQAAKGPNNDGTIQTEVRTGAADKGAPGATRERANQDAVASVEAKKGGLVFPICRHCHKPEMNCDCDVPFDAAPPAPQAEAAQPHPDTVRVDKLSAIGDFECWRNRLNRISIAWVSADTGRPEIVDGESLRSAADALPEGGK